MEPVCLVVRDSLRIAIGIFDRLRGKGTREKPAAPPRNRGLSYGEALVEYYVEARRHGVSEPPENVMADFGDHIERTAGSYHIGSEQELPHPPSLIRAALYVMLANDGEAQLHGHIISGLILLEGYLPDEVLAPYRSALDRQALQLNLLAQPEYQRLLERDQEAAIRLVAGLPETRKEDLASLHRLLNRRRSDRWADLLIRFLNRWTEDERNAMHTTWMWEQAADVLALLQICRQGLEKAPTEGMPAFAAGGAVRHRGHCSSSPWMHRLTSRQVIP